MTDSWDDNDGEQDLTTTLNATDAAFYKPWDLYRALTIALSEQTSQVEASGLPAVYDTVRGNLDHATAVGQAMQLALVKASALQRAHRQAEHREGWWEENIAPRVERVRELLPEIGETAHEVTALAVAESIASLRKVDLERLAARVRELLAG
ncbi:MAG: hypothetical protein HOY79_04250 [Streptomyces sp.]|nr:hypothetical protein [Streptomyces sp.]NUS15417.1 hypothetical protein [Streptomyces sp.]NUS24125.1 hypothetical protein [Streptomyces sp.]